MFLPQAPIQQPPEIAIVQQIIQPAPQAEVRHLVVEGDTLTSISELYKVPVERLWAANSQLDSPDLLKPAQTLKIPHKDEVLENREMPVNVEVSANSMSGGATRVGTQTPASSGGSLVSKGRAPAGWFPRGQCTHHVWTKTFVPKWNNATDWKWQAQRDGWNVSKTPTAGSIAWRVGHVAYVVAVDGSKVKISEANYNGRGSVRVIWVDKSAYSFYLSH